METLQTMTAGTCYLLVLSPPCGNITTVFVSTNLDLDCFAVWCVGALTWNIDVAIVDSRFNIVFIHKCQQSEAKNQRRSENETYKDHPMEMQLLSDQQQTEQLEPHKKNGAEQNPESKDFFH